MKNYDWPGNVRELENLIHKLIVITDRDIVDVSDLPATMRFNYQPGKGSLQILGTGGKRAYFPRSGKR